MATPSNQNARKPKKKGPIKKKKFDLFQYKKVTNAIDIPDKPVEWIKCSPALQEVTGLLGFPRGYISLPRGFSNTGKSTALLEGIVTSQKMGNLPIIFDVENNLTNDRMDLMGFDWKGDYMKLDNAFLLNEFGRKRKGASKRNEASIEDLASAMNFFLDEQECGNLPMNIDFFLDSIGVLNCLQTINAEEKDSSNNNMWNAHAYEQSFKSLLNTRIPASRKENSQYTNTLAGVQKIWLDNMGAGVVKHKGGEAFYFGSRLIYHFGGVKSNGAAKITASSLSKTVNFGVQVKLQVPKNHVGGPLGGISMEGDIISTPHGFITPDGKDKYKKDNILYFRRILGDDIKAEDITLKTSVHELSNLDEEGVDSFNDSMSQIGDDLIDTNTGEVKK